MPPLRSFPTNSDLTARTLVCANATAQYDDDEKQYDSSETARIVSRLLVPSCSFRLFSLFWNRSGVVVNPAPPGAMGHNGLAECPTDLYPDKTVFHDVKPAVLKAEHVELTVFVHAVLALGGSQMVAKYSAEKIATTLIAHDIESVSVLKLILMDEGSTRHLTDKLEGVAPFGLVALTKAHLRTTRPTNGLANFGEPAVRKKSAQELLCEWGFADLGQLTLDTLPKNTPLFDLSQKCIMLPAYMAIVVKSLRNLHEPTQTVDVGFTLVLRINYGGIAPELASEITDALQFRINELPAVFDPATTDAKWQKNLYVVTSRMVRVV